MRDNSLQAKKVIFEIVRQAGGEGLVGKLRLYKAFYAAHLFYAEQEPDYLTDWPIVHMPRGPGIDEGDELLQELVTTGILKCEHVPVGPYTAVKYSTGKELPGDQLSASAVKAIRDATAFVISKSATELSDLTHEYSRSWNETTDGREMNIYIDPIPDDEYEDRRRDLRTLQAKIARAARSYCS